MRLTLPPGVKVAGSAPRHCHFRCRAYRVEGLTATGVSVGRAVTHTATGVSVRAEPVHRHSMSSVPVPERLGRGSATGTLGWPCLRATGIISLWLCPLPLEQAAHAIRRSQSLHSVRQLRAQTERYRSPDSVASVSPSTFILRRAMMTRSQRGHAHGRRHPAPASSRSRPASRRALPGLLRRRPLVHRDTQVIGNATRKCAQVGRA